MNFTVSKSSSPFDNRETPYFDLPYFRGRCCTTTSPDAKPLRRGEHWDESMEFAVEPNLVHHFPAVCFQPTVVIVQVDAHQVTDQPIENARRQYFMPRVKTLALPAADDVKPFVELREQFYDFGGVVLQVAIERDDSLPFGRVKPGTQGGRFAEISPQSNAENARIGQRKFLNHRPSGVGRAVVDDDRLQVVMLRFNDAMQLGHQGR